MWVLLLMALVSMASSDVSSKTNEECQLPYVMIGNDCLYFSATGTDDGQLMTWLQAREACKLLGSDLADDFNMERLMQDHYYTYEHLLGRSRKHWVGASDQTIPGLHSWLDSNRIVDGPWWYDEPWFEPHTPEDTAQCVWLRKENPDRYNIDEHIPRGFGDDDCETENYFICQKKMY
ncbi:unnamed protein product [Meganyctiphanes norvegica]|uniref:C-type lectin domain-containing protein n=1 Tax=Meganyctiphanes norvegica TaxID=48144 RepID=A0AAV2R4Q9_MEGNR